MMNTFIDDVLIDIIDSGTDISKLTFVLPSKRAGNFLKRALSQRTKKTLLAPEILSIEDLIQNISLLRPIPNTELLFELYSVYTEITPKEHVEAFDSFCKWAQIIIQDFNEIDRYLIPQKDILNYLSAIKDLDHWSKSQDKTTLVSNYLSFWEKLSDYYDHFTERLISRGYGYQGLLYREAVDKLELYIQHNQDKQHVFLGFNALNSAEQRIIQELLSQNKAAIYWDIDTHFMNSASHDVSLFLRYYKQWKYFQKQPFKWVPNHYTEKKNVRAVGIPKNVGQAKYVGELLSNIQLTGGKLENTAVVLGDEALLTPMLNSIPKNIGPVNVTMGMPLYLAPMASLFDLLFSIHKGAQKSDFYYRDVVSITSNPFIGLVLHISAAENAVLANDYISKNNITRISLEKLKSLFPSNNPLIDMLFGNWKNSSKLGLDYCKKIVHELKESLSKNKQENNLSLEYLFKFNKVFNQISRLLTTYDYAKDLKTLHTLYKEILSSESLDFQGEPLKGLQVIGMLESRVIDFETVIITSVNEGVLPSGKSHNSFIPFDVKLQYGLPTYKEKDAVYTYHFYHLLQRAKNIYILYNTEVDALNGGEKSRFITQLEIEGTHAIEHYFVAPKVDAPDQALKRIIKSDAVLVRLKELAQKGFSPSALTSYIRNPLDFYYQKVLKINAFEDVEETIAANTLGTIIHNTLEELYKPLIGFALTNEALTKMKDQIDSLVTTFFAKEFKAGDIQSGKNLISFEITKRYISNFLNKEIEFLKKGHTVKIIALEKELKVPLKIPELNFPVYLKGIVDRIDECDGVTRILDYKTGNVIQSKVEIVDWEAISTDYDKYSKSFQILAYAYMMHLESPFKHPVEAGIISFKNLKAGVLKFSAKEAPRSRNKDTSITEDTLSLFSHELKKLILDICNPDIDFVEKEV